MPTNSAVGSYAFERDPTIFVLPRSHAPHARSVTHRPRGNSPLIFWRTCRALTTRKNSVFQFDCQKSSDTGSSELIFYQYTNIEMKKLPHNNRDVHHPRLFCFRWTTCMCLKGCVIMKAMDTINCRKTWSLAVTTLSQNARHPHAPR